MSNHALVLSCLDADPTVRLRDVAEVVGITERATQSILADLVRSGYVTRSRVGRRNHYVVHREAPMRHARHRTLSVGGLLDYLATPDERGATLLPLRAQVDVKTA